MKPEPLEVLEGDKRTILLDSGMVELSEQDSNRTEAAPRINKLNYMAFGSKESTGRVNRQPTE